MTEITGRDGIIIVEALATALVALEQLPQKGNMNDMRALLSAHSQRTFQSFSLKPSADFIPTEILSTSIGNMGSVLTTSMSEVHPAGSRRRPFFFAAFCHFVPLVGQSLRIGGLRACSISMDLGNCWVTALAGLGSR
jgi:hypothetical protein